MYNLFGNNNILYMNYIFLKIAEKSGVLSLILLIQVD